MIRQLWPRFLLLGLTALFAACDHRDGDGDAEEAVSTDTRRGVDLSESELEALCKRTQPYRRRVLSDERECGEDALKAATEDGEAPFSKSVCIAERERCLKMAASEGGLDELDELPCGHVDWFGSQRLATCDVTVAAFETCWKRLADAVELLSCEQAQADTLEKYAEQRGSCFHEMESKCEPD